MSRIPLDTLKDPSESTSAAFDLSSLDVTEEVATPETLEEVVVLDTGGAVGLYESVTMGLDAGPGEGCPAGGVIFPRILERDRAIAANVASSVDSEDLSLSDAEEADPGLARFCFFDRRVTNEGETLVTRG